jgi:RNA polymerase sigma factor (sigma-70 family)
MERRVALHAMPGGETGGLSPYHPHNRRVSQGEAYQAAVRGVMDREALFLEQLPVIERVIGWVCSRRGLRGADAEDFASTVKMRFVENDYEILAKYEGRSSLKTYLTSVINRIYFDFQVRRFGKWRSSAAARRMGPIAVRLEQLVYRDGLTFDEACAVLEGDPRLGMTRDELHLVFVRLPRRQSRRVEAHQLEPAPLDGAGAAVARAERQELADRVFRAVRCSVARLPARDRIFLRLVFQSGLNVANAARALRADQKALYRKKVEILDRLRADLEAKEVREEDVQELLADLDWEAALDAPAARE